MSRRRYFVSVLVLVLSFSAFYHLSLCLVSQFYCHQAENSFREKHYDLAASYLEKAGRYQTGDYEIQKELGKVFFKLGELESSASRTFLLTQESKKFYTKALDLNPLDAETAYALARGEARLEQLYQHLYSGVKGTPYRPLPYFRQAIRLRPNGIKYNYALARYLHKKKSKDELLAVIRHLARIYPSSYNYLRKEPFWTPIVKETFKEGLLEATRDKIFARNACMLLSSLSAKEKDLPAAISFYREGLNYKTSLNNSVNYIHLGHLCLKNGQFEQAGENFFYALDISRSVENDIERMYALYKREGHLEKFRQFYQEARRHFIFSSQTDILVARSLIDTKQYQQARAVLAELNQEYPSGETYYWLARIAQFEKDWDSMELAIQKATVLDPGNSQYHLIFSDVLKRLKKLDRAGKEAGLAIEHRANPSASLFNHRAWIRWGNQDYPGAIEDWKSAIALNADRADFHAHLAEAYRKVGDRTLAMEYYQKAVKLDPNNARYQKRYLEMKGKGAKSNTE